MTELRRFRAVLAYDGTQYHGFQRLTYHNQRDQQGAASVVGAVETALARLNGGKTVTVLGAGRTDSGVHATGQVIVFELVWKHTEAELLRALNATLPTDIAVQQLETAAPGFHPRYDALSRTYEYRVYLADARMPMLDRIAWKVSSPLPPETLLERMNAGAALLLGRQDFGSFGTPPRGEKGTTQRVVFRSMWESGPMLSNSLTLVYTIEANAFLYHMVRTIVAALVTVGLGQETVSAFGARVTSYDAAHPQGRFTRLAPPNGLTLVNIRYT